MTIYYKDPDGVLDYKFDWDTWCAVSETISSYTIDADTGIVVDSDSESSNVVTVWLSGGTAGQTYAVRCEIVTSDDRTDERTMLVKVAQR
ncbi:hypothetical protein ACFLXI_05175 [Chloroflexota bacterium]